MAGAGPAGSYASYRLASMGYSVLNLEEHREIGRPVECTGVVTSRVFGYVKSSAVANRVRGANVFFPGNREMHIEKSEETTVIYRDSFDRDVSAMAISAGADVRLDSRITQVNVAGDAVHVKYRHDGNLLEASSSIIVGADGANSVVRKSLYGSRPSRVVSTYQVDSAVRLPDQDSVNVYLGSESSHGFFAWAVPTGDITRIGLGTIGPGARDLFGRLQKRFPEGRILSVTGGPIPIAYLSRTSGERNLLVGDAAGIVKPLTGGGIYTGIVSAHHAATAINEAFQNQNFSGNFLSRYEKYWKSQLGRELWMDGIVQRIFAGMSDSSLSRIYSMLSSPGVVDMINSVGDIDYPSRLVMRMILRHPSILMNFFRNRVVAGSADA
ncbi:MAG: geranylgeranyl reductase family protein [Candidatus Thermoplasmatota archaeon]|nr:geranylgeranyl reductase family protein [Candidatus Thermoplasmatota archaeon]